VSDGAIRGCVVECYGRRVLVAHDAGAPLACKVRGRRLDVVAGDEVLIEKHEGSDDWTVGERLARRNVLCRSDSRGLEESIAANLDQLGVVVAPLPACDPFVVDRYVAGACLAGIAPLLIVNKLDLPGDAGDLSYIEPLRKLGLPSISFRRGREPACPNSSPPSPASAPSSPDSPGSASRRC